MTEELFRDDGYLKECEAVVSGVHEGGIELDRTVFYYTSGGQPGDTGTLTSAGGVSVDIIDTRKDRDSGAYLHVPAEGSAAFSVGEKVTAMIDWQRRHRFMRMHTCMHLLCSVIDGGVTGGSIGESKGRIDFDLPVLDLDKEAIAAQINQRIDENLPVTSSWISDEEMASNMDMVRTMSVKPPSGQGRVRLINVEGVDLQPCGGTHVKATGEIGRVRVGKIENKGKHNRRVNLHFVE
ncbi:MAG: alanyl-tRNA editing protein [Rhodospirillaceae bacterium]|jgi:misacylated tRNA(Ala) deacylase|nr:alanyl-tRNA editing protein [Rhodospirillaceae bacterium]MBT5245695.1 alanyl-tRNA editing protein [Rhodospirillaceae bacterium]MBT5562360.1 alanyl-tRNA editing protein [Rhodospirillaceae bacterium]MBT6241588.1 alanyl-tRNA editing protein [Rhodospirillaceae bacterium]MBT7138809.1 alanyl-tRNA editing protein [Rhodospirillaceae bacterium]